MSWVKLGDEFVDDAADLSDAAVRTHIDALAWSNRRLLDLRVPKRDLRRFAFSPDTDQAVKELLEAGWWVDDADTYALAYRPEWQQTREQVESRRLTNLRAQWHRRGRHDLCDHPVAGPLSAADTRADTAADPGRDGTGRGSEVGAPQKQGSETDEPARFWPTPRAIGGGS